MRRKTTHGERIEMIRLKEEENKSLTEIACQMHRHKDTVRKWWRGYRDGGWDALKPKPTQRPKQGPLGSFDPLVRYVILKMKCEHPHWGPDKIKLELTRRESLQGKAIPSRSSIAGYLAQYLRRIKGRRRRPTLARPSNAPVPVTAPHVCWQIDFKGDEKLGACGSYAPLRIVDAYTSMPLLTKLFPPGLKGVTSRDVQDALREAFAKWGRPDAIRMDRGSIFVGDARLEWPGTLILWLTGLGIHVIINDAGRPTQNAQVERSNRTWRDDVAVGANFATVHAAQTATDQADQDRQCYLPSRNENCAGRPPLKAFPSLSLPRRVFDPADEAELFDFECVELYFADWRGLRLVDSYGSISLANRTIYIGKAFCRYAIEVIYDLDLHAFVARTYDDSPRILRHFQIPEVSPGYILGLAGTDSCAGG